VQGFVFIKTNLSSFSHVSCLKSDLPPLSLSPQQSPSPVPPCPYQLPLSLVVPEALKWTPGLTDKSIGLTDKSILSTTSLTRVTLFEVIHRMIVLSAAPVLDRCCSGRSTRATVKGTKTTEERNFFTSKTWSSFMVAMVSSADV
jgi:hypothetical protein